MKTILWILFAGAVFLVIYETLLLRTEHPQEPKLELFWSYREWIWNGNKNLGRQIGLNILLFVPYGVILGMLARPESVILSAAGLSAAVETAQYVFKLGLFEFDDIFDNTIGAIIGASISMLVIALRKHLKRNRHQRLSTIFFF